jgi:hypothetical protein
MLCTVLFAIPGMEPLWIKSAVAVVKLHEVTDSGVDKDLAQNFAESNKVAV